jgi:hypothetical protein
MSQLQSEDTMLAAMNAAQRGKGVSVFAKL